MALIQFNENVHLDPEKISAVHVGTKAPVRKVPMTIGEFEEGYKYVGVVADGEQFSIEEYPFGSAEDPEAGEAGAERLAHDRRDEIVDLVNSTNFTQEVWDALEALLPFGKEAASAPAPDKRDKALAELYAAMKKT